MKIIVETPKWSFRKLEHRRGRFKTVFISPLPTPFNYGYIVGSEGEDGMPLDVILLGETVASGEHLEVGVIGRVRFLDDDVRDDKFIATLDGKRHSMAIKTFFTVYAAAKLIMGLMMQLRWTKNSFQGVEWFKEEAFELSAISSQP